MASPLLLTSGAYSAAALITSAQRCVNLYPESTPDAVHPTTPVTHLLAPGLTPVFQFPDKAVVRCVYTASNGELYAVCAGSVYHVPNGTSVVFLGFVNNATTPVRMADNGQNILIGDGSSNGYTINMSTNVISGIDAAGNSGTNGFAYTGADWVDFVDTFLVGNTPGTNRWFSSASGTLAFDPLSFGAKSGSPDFIQAVAILKRYIWVIGTLASELWYNAGGANFPFALLAGPYIEHGAVGKYGIVKCGNGVLWISQDRQGTAIVIKGEDFAVQRISTYAIEQEWTSYPDLAQAIGWSFELGGHAFVGWRFPISDKTWVVDVSTGQWHERETQDANGVGHQWRVNCATFAQGKVFAGDYANGFLYRIDPTALTDNGTPIQRLRSFPHQINELKRITDWAFTANIQVGGILAEPFPSFALYYDNPQRQLLALDVGGGKRARLVTEQRQQLILDPWIPAGEAGPLAVEPGGPSAAAFYLDPANFDPVGRQSPLINLRYSDTSGETWGPYIARNLGKQGQARRLVQWRRLGMARDRIYELSWTSPQVTALNAAWLDRAGAST